MNACDVYVSLHRSEGYGLTILESILLEKPVICTGWSGNMDFCDAEYVDLVDYDFINIQNDSDYKTKFDIIGEAKWANPDLNDAAIKMLDVYNNIKSKVEKIKKQKRKILDGQSNDDIEIALSRL